MVLDCSVLFIVPPYPKISLCIASSRCCRSGASCKARQGAVGMLCERGSSLVSSGIWLIHWLPVYRLNARIFDETLVSRTASAIRRCKGTECACDWSVWGLRSVHSLSVGCLSCSRSALRGRLLTSGVLEAACTYYIAC